MDYSGIIIGSPGSGKTTILLSLGCMISQNLTYSYSPPTSNSPMIQFVQSSSYLQDSSTKPQITLIIFDLSSTESFVQARSLQFLFRFLTVKSRNFDHIILIGNKADKPQLIKSSQIEILKQKHALIYMEICALEQSSLWPLKDLLRRITLKNQFLISPESTLMVNLSSPENFSPKKEIWQDLPKFKVYQNPIDMEYQIPLKRKLKPFYKKKLPVPSQNQPVTQKCKTQQERPKSNFKVRKIKDSTLTPLTNLNLSRRKTLMTLQVKLESGEIISQQIAHNDHSYELAKNIFRKANKKVHCKQVQRLSQKIYSQVQKFLSSLPGPPNNQISKTPLPTNPKSPNLATQQRASRKHIIGNLNISLQEKTYTLTVKQGDDPLILAQEFCKAHSISLQYLQEVKNPIEDLFQSIGKPSLLFSMNFQVPSGERTARLEVREGDDLFSVAHRFVRDNRLGPANVGKIYRLLQKTASVHYSKSLIF